MNKSINKFGLAYQITTDELWLANLCALFYGQFRKSRYQERQMTTITVYFESL